MIVCPFCNTAPEHRHSRGSMQCGCDALHCRAEGAYWWFCAGSYRLSFFPEMDVRPVLLNRKGDKEREALPEELPDLIREMVTASVVES